MNTTQTKKSPTRLILLVAITMLAGSLYLNYGLESGNTEPVACEPLPVVSGEKVAVLRIDDVQGWAWGDTTRMMIDDALSRGIVLTLGVIPKNFDSDPSIVSFLQERECNLEIALHGWDHKVLEDGVTPEFALLDEQQAKDRLQQGLDVLNAVFLSPIKTWIPPQNQHSSGTIRAATELGFTRLSTEGDAKWDYDATTWNYDTGELVNPDETMTDCEVSVAQDGVCIIMLHPQNYAIHDAHSQELYTEYYLALLDRLQAEGYTYARFADLESSN